MVSMATEAINKEHAMTLQATKNVKVADLKIGDRFIHPNVRDRGEVVFEGVEVDGFYNGVHYTELDGRSGVWVLTFLDEDSTVEIIA